MNIRDEVSSMKEKVNEVKEENKSFAMELVDTLKKQNLRLFICWLITFIAFIGLLVYTIWLYNDIGVDMSEISIEDVDTINRSNIGIGGEIWEK